MRFTNFNSKIFMARYNINLYVWNSAKIQPTPFLPALRGSYLPVYINLCLYNNAENKTF